MRGVEMMNKENIKKAVMEVKTSFMNMGKVSKSILKVAISLFLLLAVPSIAGIAVFAKSTPNPDLLFLCQSALEVSGQVIAFGFIGSIVINAVFDK
jgi:hypothetical protein